jgi:phage repressor protein C with HTH and peptisase S24 domain/DNA-binding XRE family transcriptional regulator
MIKLAEITKKKRDELGINQTDFGRRFGASQQTVADLESGTKAYPRNWRKLAALLGVNEFELTELMDDAAEHTGKTQRRPKDLPPRRISSASQLHSDHGSDHGFVHVLGRAVGGTGGEYIFNGDIIDYIQRPAELKDVANPYAVIVDGDSMSPRFKATEPVFVDPDISTPRRGDIVIVQLMPRHESESTRGFIKEFWGWTPNHLIVRQLNPEMLIRYPREDVWKVHVVVAAT